MDVNELLFIDATAEKLCPKRKAAYIGGKFFARKLLYILYNFSKILNKLLIIKMQ